MLAYFPVVEFRLDFLRLLIAAKPCRADVTLPVSESFSARTGDESAERPVNLLTLARDLKRRKARERSQSFVAEGVRTVEMLMASPLTIEGVLATSTLSADSRGLAILIRAHQNNIPVLTVSEAEFASAANTDTPQGVLAIAAIPTNELRDPPARALYLVLDALQDPGNLGTVIRTAAAFGVTSTISLPGTVDLWNAKVVRSSMGALFTHPTVALPSAELGQFLALNDVSCWAADTDGDTLDTVTHSIPERLALVVSNEGAGLSTDAATFVTRKVAIPMSAGVESLNVAVATGILLHAFRSSAR